MVARLKLVPTGNTVAPHNRSVLSSGVEIDCNLHEIEHPEGRFRRPDGTRYDICVMEIMLDPTLRPPSISRGCFVGDRADTRSAVIRLGHVRMCRLRLYVFSPREAFATLSVDGKANAASTQ